MESLKSHFVLRSMDMEGRPLGTERPPVSTERGEAGENSREFASLLTSRARDARRSAGESVEDRMAARIREGRTDAADEGYSARNEVRQRQAPAVDERPERARPEDRFGPERSGEAPKDDVRERADAAPAARDARPSGRTAASSNDDARGVSDGSSSDHGAGDDAGEDVQGSAGTFLTPVAGHGPAHAAASRAAVQRPGAVAPVGQVLAAGPRAGGAAQTQPRLGPEGAIRTANTAATKASRRAAGSAPTTSPERADAILEQLKVVVTSGSREARIQLRPADLGFIEMKIKAGGKDGVQARIAVERPETLAVLEAHLPELRAWLARDAEGPVEIDLSLLDPEADAGQPEAGETAGEGGGATARRQGEASPSGDQRHPAAARAALTRALAHTPTTDGVDFVA